MTNTPAREGLPELPPITDEDRQFLHYNPNTSDLVDFVQDYARKAIALAIQPAQVSGNVRQRFEAWMLNTKKCVVGSSDPYPSGIERELWEAWQAALAGQPAQVGGEVKFTTGHCKSHAQPGGCQAHNLHCGWPECDRKPVEATPPPPSDAAQGERLAKLVYCLRTVPWNVHAPEELAATVTDAIEAVAALAAHKGEGNG